MATRPGTARSRLPAVAMLAVAAAACVAIVIALALYLARQGHPAALGGQTLLATAPATLMLAPEARTDGDPPPAAVRLAETVVGVPAEGWAVIPVPPGRIPRRVSLSRPALGRASVWGVEAGDDAQRPVLTLLLKPGEGEAAGQAALGPLPSYHEAEQVLVVFHAAEAASFAPLGGPPSATGGETLPSLRVLGLQAE